jgi:hypothetical protein
VGPGFRRDDEEKERQVATLHVTNGFRKFLPGLGRHRPFAELSRKRVSRCVREEGLRPHYGEHNVSVTCEPTFDGTCWKGSCEINGSPEKFWLSP